MSPVLESFLARLYTDPKLRAEFLRERRGTAEAAGLSVENLPGLLAINAFALVLTAQTFERKRARHAPSSPAAANPDPLHQWWKTRVLSQRRKLRIDAYEHDLRRLLVRRTIQIRESLVRVLQRGIDLGRVVGQHVVRRRVRFEALHDGERGLPVAADRMNVRAERQRL